MKSEYRPVDLSDHCNVDVEYFRHLADQHTGSDLEARPDTPPVGRQVFRGFPFQIGSRTGDGDCFIAPGLAAGQACLVPIGRAATGVLVAHVLLDSDLWEGGPFGREVGRYSVHFTDDTTLEVPIRERLEIGNLPLPWGHNPMLAVQDRAAFMEDQHEGSFEDAGFRQTEIRPNSPAAYFLWYWRNPSPEIPIQSISFAGARPGLLVAGLTLSHLDEEPLRPRTRRTARITIAPPSLGAGDRSTRVQVDRGLVTYPQPLPAAAIDEGLPGYPGWGALSEPGSSAYVDVAAVPSATITVASGSSVLGHARWGQVEEDAHAEDGPVRIELIDPGRNWVRVTIVDEATGQPSPCRVAFQTPDGVPFAPYGHHANIYSGLSNWNVDVGGDVRLGQVTYAYIDGTCEGWLPRGPLIVDVARGFEFEPIRARVTIHPDQRGLNLTIRRWVDMNAEGWYSGDTHVHFLSSQGAMLEAAGEDLNVINLLQTQWGHLFSSTEDFTGRPLVSGDGRHVIWVSQENRDHILGHLGLLGLRRPVMPWATGGPGPGELGGALETTGAHWADDAHAQGALVVLAHFPAPNAEAPVLIATGRADAVEMYDQLAYEHLEYYRYLNDGYQLPLVAGTDKMSSGVPVGLYRTYVQMGRGQPFSFESWSAGIRAGRTFISSGPMIRMTVDGQPIGSMVRVRSGATIEVECEASSVLPMQTLQLVERGQVIDEVSADDIGRDGRPGTLKLRASVAVTGPTWLAARCGGPGYAPLRHFDQNRRGIMAHTSPIYVATGAIYDLRDSATSAYMLALVAGGREYVRTAAAHYPMGTVTHRHPHPDHVAFLEAPFIEAARKIASRR